jgi:hypothetical protein
MMEAPMVWSWLGLTQGPQAFKVISQRAGEDRWAKVISGRMPVNYSGPGVVVSAILLLGMTPRNKEIRVDEQPLS